MGVLVDVGAGDPDLQISVVLANKPGTIFSPKMRNGHERTLSKTYQRASTLATRGEREGIWRFLRT